MRNEYLLIMALIFWLPGHAYGSTTGDPALDENITRIDIQSKKNWSEFKRQLSREFQLPESKLEELNKHYQFKASDILMTVSIADYSGQPVDIISRAYFENRKQGWGYILQLYNIKKESFKYRKLIEDMAKDYITQAQ